MAPLKRYNIKNSNKKWPAYWPVEVAGGPLGDLAEKQCAWQRQAHWRLLLDSLLECLQPFARIFHHQ